RSGTISDRTGLALLDAFGLPANRANGTLITGLVAVLIRCSFYAEQTPGDMSREPLVKGVAHLLHRVLAGPVDGVNVRRRASTRRRQAAVAAPEGTDGDRVMRPRGEKTRQRLLAAGASVLPERGYHDARVDDIVTAAGVSHGTFYRYFDNKDDFFRVLAESASARMIELIDRLRLDADAADLRAWLSEWFAAYEADGGVISTWQEMQTNQELADFSRQVAASVFSRLVRHLEGRDFSDPLVDAVILLALIERVPYSVYTLGFAEEHDAIESMVTAIHRGILARPD
ncbi:MAG: TetR/AcrR family transcriptional regulator, partial [Acidimicrobiales bacterium]|nr:TetR/AcrR family transcriptional regulator [Acidimicrobiales bacterium]